MTLGMKEILVTRGTIRPNVILLIVAVSYSYAECRYTECRYAGCFWQLYKDFSKAWHRKLDRLEMDELKVVRHKWPNLLQLKTQDL
jgi:hypothetical protein